MLVDPMSYGFSIARRLIAARLHGVLECMILKTLQVLIMHEAYGFEYTMELITVLLLSNF